jgi:hypothetical protein
MTTAPVIVVHSVRPAYTPPHRSPYAPGRRGH